MRTADFDYQLPKHLIAQAPLPRRDDSRLLVFDRETGCIEHQLFRRLPQMVRSGDLVIVNDTKVISARLHGHKKGSGGRVEALLVSPLGDGRWEALVGASKPVREGQEVCFSSDCGGLMATVSSSIGNGMVVLCFDHPNEEILARLEAGAGELPLPAYIERCGSASLEVDDKQRYQTIFASRPGAVAAPTAGLHFTDRIMTAIENAGAETASLTLHVGPGTFVPVRTESASDHVMHSERYYVPESTAAAIVRARSRNGRVLAVGTTVLRALEAAATDSGEVRAGAGETALFVLPGYRFRVVDGLLTNFHLPRSTLLMLVCALGGRERVLWAYQEAIEHGYRFYSYGDAMLLI